MTDKIKESEEERNQFRAHMACRALEPYSDEDPDPESNLRDLLADILHWCERNNIDFEAGLTMARIHHEAESTARPSHKVESNPV